ncbi:MAG: PilZ domain-containing protein [Magnetococcales bacterium]|nr:PilZ domain-containing protein [Magnetococcales bacterium]
MVLYQETDVQRRAYVRVEDFLPLSWMLVEAAEQARVAAFFAQHHYFPPQPEDDVRRLLTVLTGSHELAQLRLNSPNLAHVLEQMDAKINLLLRLLHPVLRENELQPTRLNLGGDGIAFWADSPSLSVGDFLKMELTLAVDGLATISFYAQVLRREEANAEGLVLVACQFNPILDEHRERIIQHVFKRQADLLRVQRGM